MYKLKVLQPHTDSAGKRHYAGEIIQVESAIEAEKLLSRVGHNFKFFRLMPGQALPSVAAMDPELEKRQMDQAEAEAKAKLLADKEAEEKAAIEKEAAEKAAAEPAPKADKKTK